MELLAVVGEVSRRVLLDALYQEDAALMEADRTLRGALALFLVRRVIQARLRQAISILGVS